jgi:hypothetical protein
VDARIQLLLQVFDQAYTAPSWHGTPLKGSIRGVNARQALWRPGKQRHSIWDLVLHTAYWKCMVRRRLLRDPEISFPRDGANWPELPAVKNEGAWKRDRALLEQEHRLLRRAIANLDPRQLPKRAWKSRWPVETQVYGIASHDLYHAGQIQLLKRLMKRR